MFLCFCTSKGKAPQAALVADYGAVKKAIADMLDAEDYDDGETVLHFPDKVVKLDEFSVAAHAFESTYAHPDPKSSCLAHHFLHQPFGNTH
jgi:hypothetical protein